MHPAGIACQRPVRADDAMTGHHYPHLIRAICQAHGTDSLGALEPRRQRAVTERAPNWNLAESSPHATLKRRSDGLHQDPVDCRQFSGKVRFDAVPHCRSEASVDDADATASVLKAQQPRHSLGMVFPINHPQTILLIGQYDKCANLSGQRFPKERQVSHHLIFVASCYTENRRKVCWRASPSELRAIATGARTAHARVWPEAVTLLPQSAS